MKLDINFASGIELSEAEMAVVQGSGGSCNGSGNNGSYYDGNGGGYNNYQNNDMAIGYIFGYPNSSNGSSCSNGGNYGNNVGYSTTTTRTIRFVVVDVQPSACGS